MKISELGISLIKKHEGLRLTAYRCAAGVWTIGYGHTSGVRQGQTITQAEAEQLLREDVVAYEAAVSSKCPNLSQQQFDAAVSLCYNIGTGNFRSSTAARLMAADPTPTTELETAWKAWRKGGGKVLSGLIARRADEWDYYTQSNQSYNQRATNLRYAAITAVLVGAAALTICLAI